MDAAEQVTPIRPVVADAEFDSERNHQHIRRVIGADSIIPAKRGGAGRYVRRIRARMRAAFPKARYSQRALAESVISAV